MLQNKIISLEVDKYILQSTPLPPFPLPSFILYLKRKLVNFNPRWTFENLNFQARVGDFQHTYNQACHTQNEKLDLGILQHLEQLLGLGLGWSI